MKITGNNNLTKRKLSDAQLERLRKILDFSEPIADNLLY